MNSATENLNASYSSSWHSDDSYIYIHQSEVLLNGGYPTYFPNGFPILILLAMLINKVIPFEISLILANLILSCITVFLIYKCGEMIFTKSISVFSAALITALYPNQLNFVRYILTEVPSAFLLTLAFYLVLNEKIKLSALTIGILSIIKTSFLPFGLLFAGYLFFNGKTVGKSFFLFFFLPPLILILYGFIVSGELTLGNNSFHNLTLTATDLEGDYRGKNAALEDYWNYLIKDPGKYINDRIISLWELWGPIASKTNNLRESIFFRMLAGIRFPLLLLTLYSLMKLKKDKTVYFVYLSIITLTTIHFFLFSNPRFIYPLEPLLILFAIMGLELLFSQEKKSPNVAITKEVDSYKCGRSS